MDIISGYRELVNVTSTSAGNYYTAVQNESVFNLWPEGRLILMKNNPFFTFDLLVGIGGAVLLTMLRELFIKANPLLRKLTDDGIILQHDVERFGESLYNLVSYSFSFAFAAMLEAKYQFGEKLDVMWDGFTLSAPLPSCIWWLYMYETAHYWSSLYLTILKPFDHFTVVLTGHHMIALALLYLSYLSRTFPIGVTVLYVHDLCDIFLQAVKCINKLHMSSTRAIKAVRILRVSTFTVFVATWFIARLYYFPLYVIAACAQYLVVTDVKDWFPGAFLIYVLLLVIGLMNTYWAVVILVIAGKAVVGGPEAIEDIRERDDEPSPSPSPVVTQAKQPTIRSSAATDDKKTN